MADSDTEGMTPPGATVATTADPVPAEITMREEEHVTRAEFNELADRVGRLEQEAADEDDEEDD